jgi:hypothetical protein
MQGHIGRGVDAWKENRGADVGRSDTDRYGK